MYAVIPPSRVGLLGSLVPILRTVMSICASRLILNLRGGVDKSRTRQNGWEAGELTGNPSFRHQTGFGRMEFPPSTIRSSIRDYSPASSSWRNPIELDELRA